MINDYMSNFQNTISTIFFIVFIILLILLVTLLIFSLITLTLGCLIKSQKIKTKFLKIVPYLLIGNILFISIPYIFLYFKNFL